MDNVVALAAILLAIGMILFVASLKTGRALDLIGAGFVPYRGPGWPQGVQEEEPVPWSWRGPSEADQPEFHEIGGDRALEVTAVDRKGLVPGMARRRG
jgi:hypothetical protein